MPDRTCQLLLLLVVAGTSTGAAQGIPFSQHATVSQRVGYTDISISYSRPVSHGRRLFGGVVHWGRIWTPGADSATMVTLSRDVQVDGRPLRAGTYSLWMIPDSTGPWTVIFSHAVHILHIPYPGQEHDALRLRAQPAQGSHMDALAFYFPIVAPDSAVLRMQWGGTIVPLTIRVNNAESP
jgi:Protein of unknown function (DUF2911)